MSGEALALVAEGVHKTFGSGETAVDALRGADLRVRAGEFVMMMGPSGSGKTTLLSILGCVLKPTEGTVRIFDEVISDRSEAELPQLRLRYIGFIFQGHALIASLPTVANVMLPLQLRGWTRAEAREEAEDLLREVGLGDKLDKRQDELSGGQKQRVAVARAVAGSPPIVLADEPTSSLDAEGGLAVTRLLRDLAKEHGHTVVVVTHDDRITHLADRIVDIEDGQTVEHERTVDNGGEE